MPYAYWPLPLVVPCAAERAPYLLLALASHTARLRFVGSCRHVRSVPASFCAESVSWPLALASVSFVALAG